MEHIDWIVSFVIFVFVILAVITAIPKFLPETSFQEDAQFSNLVFSKLIDNIIIYNFYTDSNYNQTYLLLLDNNYGRANSNYVIEDDYLYGTILNNSKFYNFNSLEIPTKTNIFKESFLDTNNLKNIEIISGEIINFEGEAYAFEDTTIESKQNYSNIFGEYIIEPVDVNIYFNYQDNDNYSLCELKENNLKLYDKNISGLYLIDNVDVNLDDYWYINFNFKSNFLGEAECKINDYQINNNTQSSINSGKIIIKNKQEHYIDRLTLFFDNSLIEDAKIQTNYYDFLIDNNNIEIDLFYNRETFGKITLNYQDTLNYSLKENHPVVIKNSLNEHKFIGFPNTPEFLIIIEEDEEIEIILEDLQINHYDYEIEEDESFYIWINMDIDQNSMKTIYLKKTDGFQPEDSFLKDYNSQTNPDVTVYNLGNNLYRLEIENTSEDDLINHEVRIPNNVINVTTINDSLLFSDKSFETEQNIQIINKLENKYLLFNFLDINNRKTNCLIEITNGNLKIYDCDRKTIVKSRIREEIQENPIVNFYKEKETLITYEKIQDYNINNEDNEDDYYINIFNNKENIEIGNYGFVGNFKLFERISKYLNQNGEEEIVKVLIKPN